jgi:hypothetical protein
LRLRFDHASPRPNGRGPNGRIAINFCAHPDQSPQTTSRPTTRFRNQTFFRIRIAKKEASESKLWLRLLGETAENEFTKSTLRTLFKESDELTRILATILRNSK